jgi:hypothetical protein
MLCWLGAETKPDKLASGAEREVITVTEEPSYIMTEGKNTILTSRHKVMVQPQQVSLDDLKPVAIPAAAKQIEVGYKDGVITLRADGNSILSSK